VNKVNTNANITYWATGNKFSHLDHSTILKTYLMPNNSAKIYPGKSKSSIHKTPTGRRTLLSKDVDWRTAGFVPPVRPDRLK
jgi:hypothetical protein